ncbi:MAG: hypothetical protein Q7S04_02320 [Candidatus Moranbacteria bacterium]|nr:hypothetical protein [Candidatus Moranbacteria bacterium]
MLIEDAKNQIIARSLAAAENARKSRASGAGTPGLPELTPNGQGDVVVDVVKVADGEKPDVDVEKNTRVREPRAKKPTAGAPARPDLHKEVGEVPDARKEAFLTVFTKKFEELKEKISTADGRTLRGVKRGKEGDVYRFFNLDDFADYFNNLNGKREEAERVEGIEKIVVAERELGELYRARWEALKGKGATSVDRQGREKRPSIQESVSDGDKWLQETKTLIPELGNLDALKKLTVFIGEGARRTRSFDFPAGFTYLLGKNVPENIRERFRTEKSDLMKLWQVQVVKVLFDQPGVESGFANFLQGSFQELKDKKLRKTDFIERCVQRLGLKEKELEDLAEPRPCKALQDELHELYNKNFAAIEAAQQAKGSGGKPEDKKLTNEELFAELANKLKVDGVFKKGEEPLLIIRTLPLENAPPEIGIEYRDDSGTWKKGKVTPKLVQGFLKQLKTNFGWTLEKMIVVQPAAKKKRSGVSKGLPITPDEAARRALASKKAWDEQYERNMAAQKAEAEEKRKAGAVKPELKSPVDEQESVRGMNENREIKEAILKAGNFSELFETLNGVEGIQGEERFFESVYLIATINSVREGTLEVNSVTRGASLRDKVGELLKIERKAQAALKILGGIIEKKKTWAERYFKKNPDTITQGQYNQLVSFLDRLLDSTTSALTKDPKNRKVIYALKEAREVRFMPEEPVKGQPVVVPEQLKPQERTYEELEAQLQEDGTDLLIMGSLGKAFHAMKTTSAELAKNKEQYWEVIKTEMLKNFGKSLKGIQKRFGWIDAELNDFSEKIIRKAFEKYL